LTASAHLYQQPLAGQAQQPALLPASYNQKASLQQSQAEALLASTSSSAAALSSQAATTAEAASKAAATTASIASALSTNSLAGLSDWNQFASSAWSLGNNANFDLWASKQFNNAWIGDWSSLTLPTQFQLPSWVDASSQNQWNIWAQILCARQKMNALNSLSSSLTGLGNVNGLLQQSGSGLSNTAYDWLLSGNAFGSQLLGAGPWSGQYTGWTLLGSQPTGTGPWSGQTTGWTQNNGVWLNGNGACYKDNTGNWYLNNNYNGNNLLTNAVNVGPQPSGSGPWNGQYTGWNQNNGWWMNNNNDAGWYQDNTGNWYVSSTSYNGNSYTVPQSSASWNGYNGNGVYASPQPSGAGPWSGQYTGWTQNQGAWTNNNGDRWSQDNTGNWYSNTGYQGNGNGVYVGPSPTGSGPWNGQYNGWTQNNNVWYNNNNNGVGWYQDNGGNWYTSGSSTSWNNGNSGYGNGVYVGPSPSGSGPWNGQYNGWTQKNNGWYNSNGVGWYKDNSDNWYTTSSTNWNNGYGNGVYVGPNPTGSGPWNGQYNGWTQKNNGWYNSNGVGWYKDNSGNWYTTSSQNWNSGFGNGVYVGPNPTGSGPWNGQYNGWTQNNNGWYNSNTGAGWYQDSNGNWYTASSGNYWNNGNGNGAFNGLPTFGSGEGQRAGSITSTQCVSTTAGQMNATLSCSPGSVIVSVIAAAYGSNPGSCPSNVNTLNPSCTLNVTQLIQKTCQGQNQCSVTVLPNILGAPTNNGQQCSTSMNGPYSSNNMYTLVANYACGIAGPGMIGSGSLNSTSLTFTPPNSASSLSYLTSAVLASLLTMLFTMC